MVGAKMFWAKRLPLRTGKERVGLVRCKKIGTLTRRVQGPVLVPGLSSNNKMKCMYVGERGGGGGFFLACEDFGRMFDHYSLPALFFFFKWILAHVH